MKDKPLYSNSWDEPALIDNQDGVKTEFYEKDLTPEGVEVLGKLVENIKKQQEKKAMYNQAMSVVDLVISLQESQQLLLEKLYSLNSGRTSNIVEAKADLNVVADVQKATSKEIEK